MNAIALKRSPKRLARERAGLEAALEQPLAQRAFGHLPAVPVRGARSSWRSSGSARKLRKNCSTSRDRISAVEVSSLDAESTDVAALLVSPIALLSEPILVTKVSLP